MKVKLGELTKIRTGKLDANAASENGKYPFFTCSKEPLRISTYSYDCECVLVAGNGDLNAKYYNGKFDAYQRTYIIESNGDGRLCLPYLYHFMTRYIQELRKLSIGGVIKYIKLGNLTNAKIALPSIKEQKDACKKLEKIKNIINEKEAQISYLDNLIKARFVEMFGDGFETIELRNICKTTSGGTPSTKNPDYYNGTIPWVTTTALGPNHIDGTKAKAYISEEAVANSATKIIPSGSILFGIRVGVGKTSLNDVDICTNQDIVAIMNVNETKFSKLFIKHVLDANRAHYDSLKKGATILGITSDDLKNTPIPLAPIKAQKDFETFVEQVDKSKFNALKSRHKPYEFSQIMV